MYFFLLLDYKWPHCRWAKQEAAEYFLNNRQWPGWHCGCWAIPGDELLRTKHENKQIVKEIALTIF